ncbi:MAG: NUDIX hydrolase [Deltaproteobacteria bacterium]|nr:NUDIX hydrolase [Deltaproteobacteria bacterium]
MHRRPLLDLLDRYASLHPGEDETVQRMQAFIRAHADCFARTCLAGHVTGSAWVVSADHRSVLLTHHARLGRWLQLGGHADGETDPFEAALREAREESGMEDFREVSGDVPPVPLDVDVHPIPARGAEPEHFHFDVRYLLIAAPGQRIVRSDESNDLRWVPADRVEELSDEESLLRLARKARALLRSP